MWPLTISTGTLEAGHTIQRGNTGKCRLSQAQLNHKVLASRLYLSPISSDHNSIGIPGHPGETTHGSLNSCSTNAMI